MTTTPPPATADAHPPSAGLFSRAVFDPANTLVWFAMDACWLAKMPAGAYVSAVLTVISGLVLLVFAVREDRGAVYADLGMNCWIVMNAVWMVYDLNGWETPLPFVAVVAVLGAAFMLLAARHSKDLRRVRVFTR
jgi:hypothetical protein